MKTLPKKPESRLADRKSRDNSKATRQPTIANTIRLKYVGASVFTIFLAWTTTGGLEEAEHFIVGAIESKEKTCSKVLQLLECYILSEKLRAEEFKNQVIDYILPNEKSLLYDFRASSLVAQVVDRIYGNTPADSPLRRFIVDVTVSTIPKDLGMLIPDQNPNLEYVRDCIQEYQRTLCRAREDIRSPWDRHGCDHHDHSDRPRGYRCRR